MYDLVLFSKWLCLGRFDPIVAEFRQFFLGNCCFQVEKPHLFLITQWIFLLKGSNTDSVNHSVNNFVMLRANMFYVNFISANFEG